MYQLGFIGYGSMGSMLVRSFLNSGLISQEDMIVTRRDIIRLSEIKKEWPLIHTALDAKEVARNAKRIFLCVKPLDMKELLLQMKEVVLPNQHIILITGAVSMSDLEGIIECKYSKIMPTIVNLVGEGISLICHNDKVTKEEADFIDGLMESTSKVRRTSEENFDFLSDITSCGPGLIAAIFQEFAEAGHRREPSFSTEEISELLLETLYGTTILMEEEGMDFNQVKARVSTKGGVTAAGTEVLNQGLPSILDEMFQQILQKRKSVGEKIHRDFSSF